MCECNCHPVQLIRLLARLDPAHANSLKPSLTAVKPVLQVEGIKDAVVYQRASSVLGIAGIIFALAPQLSQQKLEETRRESYAEGHAEGHAEGRAEGHAEGMKEGIQKANTEHVIRMHNKGRSDADISDALDIPLDEVRDILLTHGKDN